ncbi:MAG: hypothetical protein NTX70_00640, partial [Verrucomicrobia bacterium]|nr:hypothetical protein [Verrucomicrobiota bacterium]
MERDQIQRGSKENGVGLPMRILLKSECVHHAPNTARGLQDGPDGLNLFDADELLVEAAVEEAQVVGV